MTTIITDMERELRLQRGHQATRVNALKHRIRRHRELGIDITDDLDELRDAKKRHTRINDKIWQHLRLTAHRIAAE